MEYFSATIMGERIKARRKACGIKSQEALALKLFGELDFHVNPESCRRAIGNMELGNGKRTPSYAELFKLSEILACDVDYLLGIIDLPRREVADIVEATRLTAAAVMALQQRGNPFFVRVAGQDGQDMPIPPEIAAVSPVEVLSLLLQNEEFWQTLGNLSRWTGGETQAFIAYYNRAAAGEDIASIPGYVDANPALVSFTDDYTDSLLAAAGQHFVNAARAALKNGTQKREGK